MVCAVAGGWASAWVWAEEQAENVAGLTAGWAWTETGDGFGAQPWDR